MVGGGVTTMWTRIPDTVSSRVNNPGSEITEVAGVSDASSATRTRTVIPRTGSFRTFGVSCRKAASGPRVSDARGTSQYRCQAPHAIIVADMETISNTTHRKTNHKMVYT